MFPGNHQGSVKVTGQTLPQLLVANGGRCGEMADAQDLKSWDHKKSCGFESHHRHQLPKGSIPRFKKSVLSGRARGQGFDNPVAWCCAALDKQSRAIRFNGQIPRKPAQECRGNVLATFFRANAHGRAGRYRG